MQRILRPLLTNTCASLHTAYRPLRQRYPDGDKLGQHGSDLRVLQNILGLFSDGKASFLDHTAARGLPLLQYLYLSTKCCVIFGSEPK